jgi:hypothetical protein
MQSDDVRVDQLELAFGAFRAELDPSDVPDDRRLAVHRPYERWTFEELDEFFEELRREPGIPEVVEEYESHGFRIEPFDDRASVTVRAPSRDRIEEILRILDLTPALPDRHQTAAFTVFIGHGRNVQWRVLAMHLRDRHGISVATYETVARVGQPAMDVLRALADQVSFAVLVHTAEVVGADETYHAGPNVIHETGYFQAQLGVSRALILRDEKCQPFANIAGLTELRFRTDNVQEVFGEVVALLREAERTR